MMKGPQRETIPLAAQEVRVRLPDGAEPGSVRLLVAEQTPHAEREGRLLKITVPSVLDHEVVAIDL
jgi:hypothetical protein